MATLSIIYFAYAFAFAESEDKKWANALYLRGKRFGLQALKLNDDFAAEIKKEKINWKVAVSHLDEEELSPLFWTAINVGMYVNGNKRDPQALFDLPIVLAMMDRVIEIDESFFYGGAHLFYGAYYAGLPAIAGGGPDKSNESFQKAFEIGKGKFLLTDLFYARYYATLLRDEQIFVQYISKILDADFNILPEMNLLTRVAKIRAEIMLARKDEFLYGFTN